MNKSLRQSCLIVLLFLLLLFVRIDAVKQPNAEEIESFITTLKASKGQTFAGFATGLFFGKKVRYFCPSYSLQPHHQPQNHHSSKRCSHRSSASRWYFRSWRAGTPFRTWSVSTGRALVLWRSSSRRASMTSAQAPEIALATRERYGEC